MRECVYEKNAKFDSTYRAQKNTLVPQIVCSIRLNVISLENVNLLTLL